MAISRKKKEELVEELGEKLSRSKALFMADYRGLSSGELSTLRNQLRDVETGFHVVKNSLVKLAMEEAGLPWHESLFDGPTAIGFCYEEVPASAKVIADFSGEHKELSVRGGLLGEELLSAAQVGDLASLPSAEVLIAHLVGMMAGPLVGLLNVLSAPMRDFVHVLQAYGAQLEEAEA